MSANRQRKRTRWPDELKREAIAIGREQGALVASERTGISDGTIRSWLKREGGEALHTLHNDEPDQPAGPLTIAEWIARQRAADHRYKIAVAQGDATAAQRWLFAMGTAQRNIDELRRSGLPERDDEQEARSLVERLHRDFPQLKDRVAQQKRIIEENERLRALVDRLPVGIVAEVDASALCEGTHPYVLAPYIVASHVIVVDNATHFKDLDEDREVENPIGSPAPRVRLLPASTKVVFRDGSVRRASRFHRRLGGPR